MGKENTVAAEAEELPKTIVRRVVKEKLNEISGDNGDVNLHKEALQAFSESGRIFIHYLSATAHDICTESRRQIVNADDVLKALDEIEFSEFVEPLREALDEFRKKAAGKRAGAAKTKEDSKKRKMDKETSTENGRGEAKKKDGDDGLEVQDQVCDDGEERASDDVEGANDDGEERASDDGEEQASDDGEEQASDEGEEQASGDDEEGASDDGEEAASGEGEEAASGEGEKAASGEDEEGASIEGEEGASGESEEGASVDGDGEDSGEKGDSSDS